MLSDIRYSKHIPVQFYFIYSTLAIQNTMDKRVKRFVTAFEGLIFLYLRKKESDVISYDGENKGEKGNSIILIILTF